MVAAGISFISFDFLLVSSDWTTIIKVEEEEEEHGRKKMVGKMNQWLKAQVFRKNVAPSDPD